MGWGCRYTIPEARKQGRAVLTPYKRVLWVADAEIDGWGMPQKGVRMPQDEGEGLGGIVYRPNVSEAILAVLRPFPCDVWGTAGRMGG